ncbi:MAG: hypothetical protein F2796_07950, partial [Actinobacteria bacterium]|nr:hypothetical protein [Actinomycetota bacterium]
MALSPASGLTRRHALAVGAAAGAATLLRGSLLPAPARAQTRDLVVPREAFGRDGRTGPLAAPAFVLLGVRSPLGLGASLEVRTRRRGGAWSAWHRLHSGHGHGPDHGGAPRSGEPLWTGPADELELRASRRPLRAVGIALVDVPATARAALAARARTAQIEGAPAMVPRTAWAGDAAKPREDPSYGEVQIAVVHHTESSNAYGPEDSAAAVLAVAQFHIFTRGWNDIGYNFVVDRYGTIFEGRGGGIDLPIIGAHAQGFNSKSTGISILGSFMDVEAPSAALGAVARLIGWKLPLHGVHVTGEVVVVSGGGPLSRYRFGKHVTLPRISGHRDVGSTDCPGDRLYAQLPGLRKRAAAHEQPIVPRAEVSLGASTPRAGYGREVAFAGTVLTPDKTPQVGAAVQLEKQS